jgi:hypothetical protein
MTRAEIADTEYEIAELEHQRDGLLALSNALWDVSRPGITDQIDAASAVEDIGIATEQRIDDLFAEAQQAKDELEYKDRPRWQTLAREEW